MGVVKLWIHVNRTKTDLSANVYPNPALDELNIELKNARSTIFKVFVYDMLGSEVYSCDLTGESLKIPVTYLNPGMYILKIYNDREESILNTKFAKE